MHLYRKEVMFSFKKTRFPFTTDTTVRTLMRSKPNIVNEIVETLKLILADDREKHVTVYFVLDEPIYCKCLVAKLTMLKKLLNRHVICKKDFILTLTKTDMKRNNRRINV